MPKAFQSFPVFLPSCQIFIRARSTIDPAHIGTRNGTDKQVWRFGFLPRPFIPTLCPSQAVLKLVEAKIYEDEATNELNWRSGIDAKGGTDDTGELKVPATGTSWTVADSLPLGIMGDIPWRLEDSVTMGIARDQVERFYQTNDEVSAPSDPEALVSTIVLLHGRRQTSQQGNLQPHSTTYVYRPTVYYPPLGLKILGISLHAKRQLIAAIDKVVVCSAALWWTLVTMRCYGHLANVQTGAVLSVPV
ncbi:hypothetical protein BU17DRAFT_60726 [Hysterangium stoloniferum]|nr:hypothetical protein BU17DRAFT_60726 [Hysterangium stoloniferum]